MPINSISPGTSISAGQSVQSAAANKQGESVPERKQVDASDAEKVRQRKDAEDFNARIQKEQVRNEQAKSEQLRSEQIRAEQFRKTQEAKASVNTSGQKVGTLINTTA